MHQLIKIWLKNQFDIFNKSKQIPGNISIVIPYHIIGIVAILYAVTIGFSWWYVIWAALGYLFLDGIGNNLTLHRYLSHKSWKPHNWAKPFLMWAATMVGEGSPLWWATLHRGQHHKVADIVGKDIHTPIGNGWFHSYIAWQFKVRVDSVSFRHVVDLIKNKDVLFVHENYNKVVYITLFLSWLVFGTAFTVWFFIVGSLLSLHMDGMVNTFGHVKSAGYRNYELNDHSTNVPWIGYLHGGSGWHNNHHHDASKFDFGTSVSGRWHEFDTSLIMVVPFTPWSETKRLWKERKDAIIQYKQKIKET